MDRSKTRVNWMGRAGKAEARLVVLEPLNQYNNQEIDRLRAELAEVKEAHGKTMASLTQAEEQVAGVSSRIAGLEAVHRQFETTRRQTEVELGTLQRLREEQGRIIQGLVAQNGNCRRLAVVLAVYYLWGREERAATAELYNMVRQMDPQNISDLRPLVEDVFGVAILENHRRVHQEDLTGSSPSRRATDLGVYTGRRGNEGVLGSL